MVGRPDLIRGKKASGKRKGRGRNIPANNTATAQHPAGCTLAAYAVAKKLSIEFLRSLGLTEITLFGAPVVRIPYPDEFGAELVRAFADAVDGKDKFRWRKGSKLRLYGLNRVAAARDLGEMVIVEGESDCHTLWHAGLPAIGLPGAGNWNEQRDAALFDKFDTIYVIIEPDKGGETVRKWVGELKIRDRVKLVRLNGFKDPSALYLDDPDHFAGAGRLHLRQPFHGARKPALKQRPRARPPCTYAESWHGAPTFCGRWLRPYVDMGSSERNARSS